MRTYGIVRNNGQGLGILIGFTHRFLGACIHVGPWMWYARTSRWREMFHKSKQVGRWVFTISPEIGFLFWSGLSSTGQRSVCILIGPLEICASVSRGAVFVHEGYRCPDDNGNMVLVAPKQPKPRPVRSRVLPAVPSDG
jgi:hypothetical protein